MQKSNWIKRIYADWSRYQTPREIHSSPVTVMGRLLIDGRPITKGYGEIEVEFVARKRNSDQTWSVYHRPYGGFFLIQEKVELENCTLDEALTFLAEREIESLKRTSLEPQKAASLALFFNQYVSSRGPNEMNRRHLARVLYKEPELLKSMTL